MTSSICEKTATKHHQSPLAAFVLRGSAHHQSTFILYLYTTALLICLVLSSGVHASELPHDPTATPRNELGATANSNWQLTDKKASDVVTSFYYDFIHRHRDSIFQFSNKSPLNTLRSRYVINGITVPSGLPQRTKELQRAIGDIAIKSFSSLFPEGTFGYIYNPHSLINYDNLEFIEAPPGFSDVHTDDRKWVLLTTVNQNRYGNRLPDPGTYYLKDLEMAKKVLPGIRYPFTQFTGFRVVPMNTFSGHIGHILPHRFAAIPTPHASPPRGFGSPDRVILSMTDFVNEKDYRYDRLMLIRLSYLIEGQEKGLAGSPRVDRRLIFLRGLVNEQKTWIFSRSTGTSGSVGINH